MTRLALLLGALVALVVACAPTEDRTAERASAKCHAVVEGALDPSAHGAGFYAGSTVVDDLGAGERRVSGDVTFGTGPARNFVCDVAPDASDPHSFRVTRLALSSPTDPTPRLVRDYLRPASASPDPCRQESGRRSGGWVCPSAAAP